MGPRFSRREALTLLAAIPALPVLARDNNRPAVAIARCLSYSAGVGSALDTLFDQLGGLSGLVANKTVTIKLNLTGSPDQRFQSGPLGSTHYVHPQVALALAFALDKAGAK